MILSLADCREKEANALKAVKEAAGKWEKAGRPPLGDLLHDATVDLLQAYDDRREGPVKGGAFFSVHV